MGKTAVVEGLALRIATGDVPPPLQGMSVQVLDMGLLQAGAGAAGIEPPKFDTSSAQEARLAYPYPPDCQWNQALARDAQVVF